MLLETSTRTSPKHRAQEAIRERSSSIWFRAEPNIAQRSKCKDSTAHANSPQSQVMCSQPAGETRVSSLQSITGIRDRAVNRTRIQCGITAVTN